jgi:DNA-binding XRE family transcriptional regulator
MLKPTTFPNRLRVLRAERKVPQVQVAQLIGVGLDRYWRIENGYYTPTPEERKKLSKVFGVPASDIWPASQAGA